LTVPHDKVIDEIPFETVLNCIVSKVVSVSSEKISLQMGITGNNSGYLGSSANKHAGHSAMKFIAVIGKTTWIVAIVICGALLAAKEMVFSIWKIVERSTK
jgi:hypothetical protein